MPESPEADAAPESSLCACGHHWDWHDDGRFNCLGPTPCHCLEFRDVLPGAPTPTQVIGDEMAEKRSTQRAADRKRHQAAAPSTRQKRNDLTRSKKAELFVKDMVGGKRTGQYGRTDVELKEIAGFEVKNMPEFPALLLKILAQSREHNKGTGRLSMGAIVNKPGVGGRREGIFFGWLSDYATFIERVQDDGD